MTVSDTMTAAGQVVPYFKNLKTGDVMAWPSRHNTISHEASSAMAAAFAGDPTYIPNRIGFIYGSNAVPAFSTIDRNQSWESLKTDLSGHTADVQVQAFSCTPTLKTVSKTIGGTTVYGKAATFHAHSDSVTAGAFGTTGVGAFTAGKFIYQAVLLNFSASGYKVLARVTLKNQGSSDSSSSAQDYKTKPTDFEIALDWTIKFF